METILAAKVNTIKSAVRQDRSLRTGTWVKLPVEQRRCTLSSSRTGYDVDQTFTTCDYDHQGIICQCILHDKDGFIELIGDVTDLEVKFKGLAIYGNDSSDELCSSLFSFPNFGISAYNLTERTFRRMISVGLYIRHTRGAMKKVGIEFMYDPADSEDKSFGLSSVLVSKNGEAERFFATTYDERKNSLLCQCALCPVLFMPIYSSNIWIIKDDKHNGKAPETPLLISFEK